MEYESTGEGDIDGNSQSFVECEIIGKDEVEGNSQAPAQYENSEEEESESDSDPVVDCESNWEDLPESDSQALVEYESSGTAAHERKHPCSLLQRRGKSLSRMHLALSTSKVTTLVNFSGQQADERSVAERPHSGSGNYERVKLIGIDGEGIIHLMRSRATRQLVVRKTVEYARLAFNKPIEAAILQDILRERHDNIVRLDAFEPYRLEGARYYFEYCSGGDLHQLVEQYRKNSVLLPEPFIWQTYQKLASALEFLHRGFDPRCPDPERRGICHRDIKPSNIFLRLNPNSEYPDVVLGDFGHATLDFATYDPAGTAFWQPPELPRHSPRGDVYSLGAVIHFLIHFKAPIADLPDSAADTESVQDAWAERPEARQPIMELVDEYSHELVCMMLIALEADETKRRNARQLLKFVNECIERLFPPGSELMHKATEEWPMASWAFDYMLSGRGRGEDAGAKQYFEMMDKFECGVSRESSLQCWSSTTVSSIGRSRVGEKSSRGSGNCSISSLGQTF